MTYRRLLGVAALLFLVGSTIVARAGFGPHWGGGAPQPPPGGCGTVPAQAAAAGFSTCVMNNNFTELTGSDWLPVSFSGPVSTVANWVNCANVNDTSVLWHAYFSGSNTCNPVINTTGPGGGQAMDCPYNEALSGGPGQCIISSGLNNGAAGILPFQQGFYWEMAAAIGLNANNGEGTAYTNQTVQPGNTGCTTNCDYFNDELSPNNYMQLSAGTNGSDQPGPLYANNTNYDSGGCIITPCYANLPGASGFSPAAYHVYGFLETTNGPPNYVMYGCFWVDNVFQTCDSGANLTSLTNAAQAYTNSNWFLLYSACYSGTCVNSDYYTKYMRVWRCSMSNNPCPGATLVTGSNVAGGGSPTYYH